MIIVFSLIDTIFIYVGMLTLCFAMVCFAEKSKGRSKYLFLLMAILIPTLFSAFKAEEYRGDFASYLDIFRFIIKNASSLNDALYIEYANFKEPGFGCILYLLSLFSSNSILVFGIIYFAMLLFVMLALYQMKNIAPVQITYLFYLCLNLLFSWNGIRQSLGGAIALLGIGLLLNKRKLITCIVLIIAGAFIHLSTVIFMVVPGAYITFIRKSKFILILIVLVIPLVSSKLVDAYQGYFVGYNEGAMINILKLLVVYLPVLILLTRIQKLQDNNPAITENADSSDKTYRFIKIFICVITFMLVVQISGLYAPFIASRLITLFYPILPVIYGFIFHHHKFSVKVYLCFIVFFYHFFYCSVQTGGPYIISFETAI